MARQHEGLVAGVIPATVVWLWLALVDAIAGNPFETAHVMGGGVVSVVLSPGGLAPEWVGVVVFTIIHFAIWIIVGTVVLATIRGDDQAPGVVLWPMVTVLVLQVVFVGWAAMLTQTRLGSRAWLAIIGGELLGWVALAWYLVRQYPAMLQRITHDAES